MYVVIKKKVSQISVKASTELSVLKDAIVSAVYSIV